MDIAGSEPCAMAGFDNGSISNSGSATRFTQNSFRTALGH
jgi:hypothetical protein